MACCCGYCLACCRPPLTHQLEDELFFVQVAQLIPGQALRPAVAVARQQGRAGRRGAVTPKTLRVADAHGQERGRAVDRVDDGLEQAAALELVRRDLAHGRGCARAAARRRLRRARTGAPGHAPRDAGGPVSARGAGVRRRHKWAEQFGARAGRGVRHQPRVHHLPRRLPAEQGQRHGSVQLPLC